MIASRRPGATLEDKVNIKNMNLWHSSPSRRQCADQNNQRRIKYESLGPFKYQKSAVDTREQWISL